MTEPIVFRKSFAVALLTALRAVLPPVAAVAVLRLSAAWFDVDFDVPFQVLAVLVLSLGALILRPPLEMGRIGARGIRMTGQILLRWAILLAVLLAVGYATKLSAEFSRRVVSAWMLVTPIVLIALMYPMDRLFRRAILAASVPRRVVFAGYNDNSRSLAGRFRDHPQLCMSTIGYFDDRSAERLGVQPSEALLGGLQDLAAFVKQHNIDVIFIALPMRHVQRVLNLLDELRDTTCSIYYVPDVFVVDLIQSRTVDMAGIPAIAMCETPFYGHRGTVKRLMDVVLGSMMLLAALPILVVVAIAVKTTSKGSVFFKQRRYGLDGQEIVVYKFRTMTVSEDGSRVTQATRDDQRITPVGRVLRKYSLDELPQLVNVLQGRMSLVGPRPHAVAHNEEYRKLIKGYMVRHKVLPGITGLAQVNGCRGETSKLEEMQARIDYDLDYLRHWSPVLDLKILGLTVLRLVSDAKAY